MTSSAAVFIPLFTLYDSALICSLQTLRSFYIWSCEQPQVCFTAAMELVLWLCFYLLAVLIRYLDSNVSRTLGLCLTLSKYWYSFYNRGCDVVPLELLATSRLLNCCHQWTAGNCCTAQTCRAVKAMLLHLAVFQLHWWQAVGSSGARRITVCVRTHDGLNQV